jgi:adenine C2-methylase RlmN of 23S rRNA A2503 and tRNA A37
MKEASEEIIESYLKTLTQSKIKVTYRRSRGEDIAAACGQLANKL